MTPSVPSKSRLVMLISFLLAIASLAPVEARGADRNRSLTVAAPVKLVQVQDTTSALHPGDELTIYVLTIQPGDEIWEKFGHNTIWVHDASIPDPRYADAVYNWGLFDFNAPHFYSNFIFGTMEYSMAPFPLQEMFDDYQSANRSMWAQKLNLSAAQKVKLRDFLQWNARPENRFYRYDYYRDNCSTRVRDAIDLAVDGQLKAQLATTPAGTTYRWHTRRLTQDSIFWYTALNTVLGPATDKPLSQWQECFLPLKLMAHLRDVTIKDENGHEAPLVADEKPLFIGTRNVEPQAPPEWLVQYFLAGAIIGIGFVTLARWSKRGRWKRFAAGGILTIYSLVISFVAWLSLWAWGFSHHWSAWRNENLFGYSPLFLPLIALIPMIFRCRPRIRRTAIGLALAIVGLTVIGCILCPFLPQVNGEPMAVILPINLGLAGAVWIIAHDSDERDTACD